MADVGAVKIVKVGQPTSLLNTVRQRLGAPAKGPTSAKSTSKHRTSQPKYGVLKRGKTARKTPRFEAVRDPAKSPPVKRPSRLRILTEHGAQTRRAKISRDAKTKSISEIRKTLKTHNLNVRDHTPEHLARKIYEDAKGAGMIS